MGISINGPSGIDTQYIIDSLVGLEQNKVTAIESQKKAYQVKINAYSKLQNLLNDVKSKAEAIGKTDSFDIFKTSSSDEDVVTISGGAGSVDAQYDIQVFQLSTHEKMISSNGLISDQNAALTDFGITPGEISVDGVSITIDGTDTLQDLRMKINNAVDADGKRIGVSASVLKIADDNFRLVLSSKESGSDGIAYEDISGSTLQDLGIIQDAAGDKGITNQVVSSTTDIAAAFTSLADGETIAYSGTDHNGNEVNGLFLKKAGSTIADFQEDVATTFHGMVEVAVDGGSGVLSMTDKVSGTSRLSLSSMTFGTNPSVTSEISTYGDEGRGVLSTGKDAWYSIENITMSSKENKASDVVTGVTLEFHNVSDNKSVNVELNRDTEGIRKKFQELIDSYNALVRFKKDSTQMANPDDEESKSGDLAGDSTVSSIVSQVRMAFRQQFEIEDTAYTNFTMLGLKTDTLTGGFTLDTEKFDTAIETDLDNVIKLFATSGISDNSNVVLGRSTEDTQAGKYIIEEVDADHFRIQLEGSTEWTMSKTRVGDIITFDEGPAEGLSLTASAGSIGGGSVSFNLMKGLSSVLDESINKLNDTHDGLISMRQKSIRKSMDRADDRILKLEDRIERYRLRLVKQFSEMEKAMSQMQSQSTNMINSFSYTKDN